MISGETYTHNYVCVCVCVRYFCHTYVFQYESLFSLKFIKFPTVQVLETVTSLNLSHNQLHSLDGITAFVSMTALNLNYNLVGSKKDLNRIMKLRHLKTVCLQGENYVMLMVHFNIFKNVSIIILVCVSFSAFFQSIMHKFFISLYISVLLFPSCSYHVM